MYKHCWQTALLLVIALSGARAGVVSLPTGNFACGMYTLPFFGSALVQDCTSAGAATAMAPPSDGLQGVSLGYSGDVTWDVSGDPSVSYDGFQEDDLTLSTDGLTGGSGLVEIYLPLHYDFTIDPLDAFTCVSSDPCTAPDVNWNLLIRLSGPAVTNSDGVSLIIASGTGTGEFSGDATVPRSLNPFITTPSLTIAGGSEVAVDATLQLSAAGILPDSQGSYSVLVPQGATFDFRSAESIPEPGTMGLMLGAAALAAAWRRVSRRCAPGR